MSLDGVVKDPGDWQGPFFGEDAGQFAADRLFTSDVLLLGRGTYEVFASAWPSVEDDGGFAEKINSMPKYVVSSTLDKGDWNNTTVIKGDVVEAVKKLKEESGKDILVYGVGQLAHALLQAGLVDELEVWIHPILRGTGFDGPIGLEGSHHDLKLVKTDITDLGIIIAIYEPVA